MSRATTTIGNPSSSSSPFGDPPLALAEGVNLRGRIDLVEKHVTREAFRVTDHKTGKRPDTIPRWVGGGRSLQPLLYGLAAEQLLGSPVEAGRLLYATQRGGYTPIEIKLDERARLFLQKLLGDIDAVHCRAASCLPRPPKTPVRFAITASCAGLMKNAGSTRKTGTMFDWSR